MAEHRHKRETNARLKPRAISVAAPLAVLATTGAVTVGVVSADPRPGSLLADAPTGGSADAVDLSRASASVAAPRAARHVPAEKLKTRTRIDQADALSRSAARDVRRLWTTADLNLWTGPGDSARQVGEVDEGEKIVATGREAKQRVEVVVDGQVRWVSDGYLSKDKPAETGVDAALSMAACPDPGVENGLTDDAVRVYRAVCNAFPQITSYGGWDAHGEHSSGRAIDIMTTDKALGDQIAEFLKSHAAELNLYDVIWWDRIWTPVRASEGWRGYGDRGSATANHMDHVHVSTNG